MSEHKYTLKPSDISTMEKEPTNIHVIDQAGQPYGSVRRCCNRCGAMAVDGMWIVQSISEWNELPEEQRCKL